MSSWVDSEWLSLDLEATGVDATTDRIVTASLIRVTPDQRVTHEQEWLADPGVEIPPEAEAIHGVSTERARREGAPVAQVVDEIAEALADQWTPETPMVICNAPYDLTMLDAELRRHHGRQLAISGYVLDPLVCDRRLDKYRKGRRTLTALCGHYQVDLSAAHTSAADTRAAAVVMRRLVELFPGFRERSLDQVHRRQVTWHQEWAEGYESYLRDQKASNGATDLEILETVIDRAWPIRPPVPDPMRIGGRNR